MKNIHTNSINERGFASVVVALIMVLVLGLISTGFAQLSRKEQNSALNKQLAAQANYAAESGINDALSDIKLGRITANGGSGLNPASKSICMTPSAPAKTNNQTLNLEKDVTYRCLLVDLAPTELEWASVEPETNRTLSFNTDGLTDLTFNWESLDSARKNNFRSPSDTSFTPKSGWNSPAVIQFMIVPVPANDRISRNPASFTAYLYPSTGSSNTVAYSTVAADQGKIVPGNCIAGKCSVTISGLGATGANTFLVYMFTYYDSANISASARNGGTQIPFKDSQAMIDVTGKARNVLKRLNVRVPIKQITGIDTSPQSMPNFALEAQNICKRIKSSESFTIYDRPTEFDPMFGGIFAAQGVKDPCDLSIQR